jgi:hypothetical protein
MTWDWGRIITYALVNGCLFYFYLLPQNGVEGDARLNLALAIAGSVGIAGGVYNKKR